MTELQLTPAEKALFEVACVAADQPGMFDDVKAACAERGLIHLGYGGGKPTNELTDGDELTPAGQRAWLAAVEAFCNQS